VYVACHIVVSDTGPGIAADLLPYIFEMFYPVGEHARCMGAGLGLSFAHVVIEAHGGSITAESEPDHGTTFHILLPLDPSRTGIHVAGPDYARAG
jgi:signal transduction histidine kinase